MSKSAQRKTADAIVEAFNKMDIGTIMSVRSPECLRYYLPTTMGYPPQENASYEQSLRQLVAIFTDFSLVVDDVIEDKDARTICMWLTAKANTAAGLYQNDYVWLWNFDESGTKILRSKEYSDSVQNKEFWPLLQAAMRQQQDQKAKEDEDGSVKVQA